MATYQYINGAWYQWCRPTDAPQQLVQISPGPMANDQELQPDTNSSHDNYGAHGIPNRDPLHTTTVHMAEGTSEESLQRMQKELETFMKAEIAHQTELLQSQMSQIQVETSQSLIDLEKMKQDITSSMMDSIMSLGKSLLASDEPESQQWSISSLWKGRGSSGKAERLKQLENAHEQLQKQHRIELKKKDDELNAKDEQLMKLKQELEVMRKELKSKEEELMTVREETRRALFQTRQWTEGHYTQGNTKHRDLAASFEKLMVNRASSVRRKMCENLKVDASSARKLLCDIFVEAYKESKAVVLDKMFGEIFCPHDTAHAHAGEIDITVASEQAKVFGYLLYKLGPDPISLIQDDIHTKVQKQFPYLEDLLNQLSTTESGVGLQAFIDEAAKLACDMLTINPPMIIDCPTDFNPGKVEPSYKEWNSSLHEYDLIYFRPVLYLNYLSSHMHPDRKGAVGNKPKVNPTAKTCSAHGEGATRANIQAILPVNESRQPSVNMQRRKVGGVPNSSHQARNPNTSAENNSETLVCTDIDSGEPQVKKKPRGTNSSNSQRRYQPEGDPHNIDQIPRTHNNPQKTNTLGGNSKGKPNKGKKKKLNQGDNHNDSCYDVDIDNDSQEETEI